MLFDLAFLACRVLDLCPAARLGVTHRYHQTLYQERTSHGGWDPPFCSYGLEV